MGAKLVFALVACTAKSLVGAGVLRAPVVYHADKVSATGQARGPAPTEDWSRGGGTGGRRTGRGMAPRCAHAPTEVGWRGGGMGGRRTRRPHRTAPTAVGEKRWDGWLANRAN